MPGPKGRNPDLILHGPEGPCSLRKCAMPKGRNLNLILHGPEGPCSLRKCDHVSFHPAWAGEGRFRPQRLKPH